MVVRTVLTFSVWVSMIGLALAGPYSDLDQQLKHAPNTEAKLHLLESSPLVKSDPRLLELLKGVDESGDAAADNAPHGPDSVAEVIELRSLAEQTTGPSQAKSLATEIKQSPIYSDPGEREETNWLGRAFARLKKWHLPRSKPNARGMNLGFLGDWIIYAAWFVLGVAVLLFLLFVIKKVDLSSLRLPTKKGQLVEEDEADRTLDEWLVLADQLEKEGRYREAVRSLYLACLMKFDESRVARFDRGQTNWEHLARIEASPRLPDGLNFREPTKAFDRIWYGYQVNGSDDVQRFRTWYQDIVDATRLVAG